MSLLYFPALRLTVTQRSRLPHFVPRTKVVSRHNSSRSNIPSNPANAKEMTKEELHRKLEEANETMKAYYSFPPDKVIQLKKAKFNERHRDSSFYIQLGLGM
jgi:hypothetical protein